MKHSLGHGFGRGLKHGRRQTGSIPKCLGLAAILMTAVVACGQQQHAARSTTASPEAPIAADAAESPDWQLTRKEDIRSAWNKIGELRQDPLLGLSREPAGPLAASTALSELRQCVAGTTEPEVSEGCTDVCTIKDAICDNAEDICRIAAELDGDAWAADKCNSAKTSCKEAKEICCGCAEDDS